eukprot:3933234-Rhodomonas_salina.2
MRTIVSQHLMPAKVLRPMAQLAAPLRAQVHAERRAPAAQRVTQRAKAAVPPMSTDPTRLAPNGDALKTVLAVFVVPTNAPRDSPAGDT